MFKLRDYEQNVIKRIEASAAKRKLVVGPTGAGKTVVAARIMRKRLFEGKRVLFVAHRRELITQAKKRLIEHGVSQRDIGLILSGFQESRAAQIQIASIDTLRNREKPRADLLIIDEAHRAKAATYLAMLDHYSDADVIGLTATPYRLDASPLGDIFEEIIEMAKPSELIEAGWLMRPRIFTVPPDFRPDLSDVRTSRGDYFSTDLTKVSNKKHLVGSIVDHWKRLAENRPTVAYAVSVEHAKSIAAAFRGAGIASEVLTGDTDHDERDAMLHRLKSGSTKVICNCMVLTEGWDCPEAKCCIMARPTQSLALWIQMGGRFMRPGNITPLILDHAGNANRHWVCPGDDQEFSLDSKQPKHGGECPEKECPECDSFVAVGFKTCPNCGHEFWSGEMPDEVQAQLVELKSRALADDEKREYAMALYAKGSQVSDLARRFGVNKGTICRWAAECGIQKQPQDHSELGDNVIESIRELAKRGLPFGTVAKTLGLSVEKVRRAASKHGIVSSWVSPRDKNLSLSPTDINEKLVERRTNYTAAELAKIYNVTSDYVRNVWKKWDADHPSEKAIERKRILDEMIAMYNSGMSTTEIAVRLGRDPGNTYTALKNAGVKMRERSVATSRAMIRYATEANPGRGKKLSNFVSQSA